MEAGECGVVESGERGSGILGEEVFGGFEALFVAVKSSEVEHLHALHEEVVGVRAQELLSYVERALEVVTGIEEHGVSAFVFGEVVGVLDVSAILLGGFLPVVAFVVFLGELALSESRVGFLGEELFELRDGEVGVNVEVGVGIFHEAFGVVIIVADSHFVLAGSTAEVLSIKEHVALEDVDRRLGVLGVFVSFFEEFGYFFFVAHLVSVVVSAGDGNGYFIVFLVEALSFLEVVSSGRGDAVEEVDCAEPYVVVGICGVGLDAFVKECLSLCFVAFCELYLPEVVVCQGLVSAVVVESAVEDSLGVVNLSGFEVFDAVLIALALSCGGYRAGSKQC